MNQDEPNRSGLSAPEKKRQLFLRQKELLLTFLERGAISQAQFDKSYGDLCRKMGFESENDRKSETEEIKMKDDRIFVEGHRGYCAEYPENTLLSYEKAIDLGVDGIEFDVWLTSDKVPVLMHDGNAFRTCGVNRHLRDMTLEEVKQMEAAFPSKFGDRFVGMGDPVRVPTLEELLRLCARKRPDLVLGVEIKEYTEETVDLTVALLKRYGFFDDCCFYAFNARIIRYLKTRYGARTMGYPDFQMKEWTPGSYDFYDEIGLSLALVRSEIFPIYQAKNLPIHMYCADNPDDVSLCADRGAVLITANDPVPLMRYLGLEPNPKS